MKNKIISIFLLISSFCYGQNSLGINNQPPNEIFDKVANLRLSTEDFKVNGNVKILKMSHPYGNINSTGNSKLIDFVVEFDAQGRLVKRVNYREDKPTYYNYATYQKNKVIVEFYYPNEVFAGRTSSSYDNDGNIIETESITFHNAPSAEKYTYTYNENNQLIEKTRYYVQGNDYVTESGVEYKYESTEFYAYDDNKKVKYRIRGDNEPKNDTLFYHLINEKGKLEAITRKNWKPYKLYIYDDNSNLIEIKNIETFPYERNVFKYDDNNNLIEWIFYSNDKEQAKKNADYDEFGNPTSIQHFQKRAGQKDLSLYAGKYSSYTYDASKNWILEKATMVQGRNTLYRFREIIYH